MKADTRCRATSSDKPANVANSPKMVEAGADYFRDVSLRRQRTVEINAEIVNGLYWLDDRGTSVQGQVRISKFFQHLA